MDNQRILATLYAWCTLNGFDIDPRLKFDWNMDSGCGVYSKESLIPVHTKLVRIPKHAVLSTKNCTLSPYIPASPYGLGAQLALALALYIEILKGRFSRWFGYLQSLHQDIVNIPVFWNTDIDSGEPGCHRRDDGTEALRWLRGTEVAKVISTSTEDNISLIDELRNYYREVVEPFIHRHRNEITSQHKIAPTLHGFYRAFSLVSSRAFVVDAYHGLCMVPVADLFNHECQHHVHLESDYHVCPECGSLHECLHDHAESPLIPTTVPTKPTPRVLTLEDEEQGDDYHMVSVTAIPPGIEVFNTYGETLTNAQLLTQYGFILEANENDILAWDLHQVLDLISDNAVTMHNVPRILHSWKQLCEEDWTSVSRSGFLYLVDAEASRGCSLALNGDGKISHPLWIVVALFSLDQTNYAFSEESSHLRSLLDAQCRMEDHLENRIDGCTFDLIILKELEQVSRFIIRLCVDRKSKTGLDELPATVSDVGDYFDTLPDSRPRTKMALSVVLGELSILNNCEATWSEMLNVITECLYGNQL